MTELNEKRTSGVIFTKFGPARKGEPMLPYLLYYGDYKLTDEYNIKYPVVASFLNSVNGEPQCTGSHDVYLYQPKLAKVGDFVTTCEVRGCAFATPLEEVAFGVIEDIYEDSENLVGRARVRFL